MNASRAGSERHFPTGSLCLLTTAPAPVHNIMSVFSLAVFSSLPDPTEQLQLFKLQLLHPSDPCKGNVYTAIFQGVVGCGPAFCPAFWLPWPPPSAQATQRHEQSCSGVRRNVSRPAHHLCSLFFFVLTTSLPVKGRSSTPGLCLAPAGCPHPPGEPGPSHEHGAVKG